MLQTHPAEEAEAESQVEQSLVRDGEDDERWRKLQEHDYQAVHVVAVGVQAVQLRYQKGSHWSCVSVPLSLCLSCHLPSVPHPTTSTPRGRPCRPWTWAMLLLVTTRDSKTRPSCRHLLAHVYCPSKQQPTWTPSTIRDLTCVDDSVFTLPEPPSESILPSKSRYRAPIANIMPPPSILSKVS
jgi:hypothetical protein